MFWQKWDLNSCLLVLELVSILPSSTKVIVDQSVVNIYLYFPLHLFWLLETRFLCVTSAVLELTL